MRKRTVERLQKVGVYCVEGTNYNPITAFAESYPLCAIWYKSEEPTKEEISLLSKLPKRIASHYNHGVVKDFRVEGANMVTVKKEDGKWTYRRMTWREGPMWHTPTSTLQAIMREI